MLQTLQHETLQQQETNTKRFLNQVVQQYNQSLPLAEKGNGKPSGKRPKGKRWWWTLEEKATGQRWWMVAADYQTTIQADVNSFSMLLRSLRVSAVLLTLQESFASRIEPSWHFVPQNGCVAHQCLEVPPAILRRRLRDLRMVEKLVMDVINLSLSLVWHLGAFASLIKQQ